ncbi:IPIL1 protein, partial [Rhodinocichla rosea]|nr:IPIL1 protein [Rhodinocichla rosea]
TIDLMDNYMVYFGHVLSNSFYPVLQRAIGVGSAFEGWSPREQDVVYRVLIPMTPPRGHSFHLELDSAGQRHARNFRVCVQLDTLWLETYDVAEMKFFKHIARQAPPDSLHLRCLQLFSHLQLGIGFSTYTMKTIVMHLLNTTPVSRWRRRYFLRRLGDINVNVRRCLEQKCLKHFIIGNKRLPQEISLPLDIASAQPPNLFHHLAWHPVAHSQAMSEYRDL